jgi:hypothetical protein
MLYILHMCIPQRREGERFLDKDANNSFLVLVYSALFDTVIEALNLVLEKIFSRNSAA